ncbi:MAG: carbohydrate binding family 9 domain-containing protein [Gemmatimonadetes bacterium]|nr:carbohydrate binding family 9 domain-containing protein [Gemmatimonadota bacterium]
MRSDTRTHRARELGVVGQTPASDGREHIIHAKPGRLLAAAMLIGTLWPVGVAAQRAQTAENGSTGVSSDAARYTVRAEPLRSAIITIDGKLDEPIWATADSAVGFIQFRPHPDTPGSERSVARVLYDGDAIYVGARMYDDHPDSIVARLMRRDDKGFSDWFAVGLDSYHDHRTSFTFFVNPRGVRYDEIIFDDTQEDGNWDAVWEAAARVDSLGWTAEIRIPLSQLRYADSDSTSSWGIDFYREIARRGEEELWAPLDPDQAHIVSTYGTLTGLGRLPVPSRIEVAPYAVTRLERLHAEPADPFWARNRITGDAGADVKYGLTPNLTLTATINPDFGQVEADPSVVNLTAYETFFPEKRPFFQEGSNIFRFGIGVGDGDMGNEQLFYSRRIGRAPHEGLPDSASYGNAPEGTTILGAGKVSGKTASGWSVGLMDAVTARETAPFVTDAGTHHSMVVEPMTNYAVGRLIKDFRHGQSAVGGIVTSTSRELHGTGITDLASSAVAGGLNGRHQWANGNWQLTGWLLGSRVAGDPAAIATVQTSPVHYFQRPDAPRLGLDSARTSLQGFATQVQLAKTGGGHWIGGTILHAISPGFEVNDLGFQTQSDLFMQVGFLGYRMNKAGKRFRQWSLNASGWRGTTFGEELVSLGTSFNGYAELLDYWSVSGGGEYDGATLSTGALRGGPALRRQPGLHYWGGVHSDGRKSLVGGLSVSATSARGAPSSRLSLSPSLSWRPTSAAEVTVEPSVSWNRDAAQYVAQDDFAGTTHYYFGHLRQTTVALTTRVNYTVSPTLSFQLYAEPFVSAGRYSGFEEVTRPHARSFADRFHTLTPGEIRYDAGAEVYRVAVDGTPDAAAFDKPDFNFKQLRSVAVLRWEYRPGSTLFLVWTQSRTGSDSTGTFRFGRDFGRLLGFDGPDGVPGDNVFLVKVSYWLGR